MRHRWVHTVPWRRFYAVTLFLPIFGLVYSVGYFLHYDFSRITMTDCHVYNFFPSISAAVAAVEEEDDPRVSKERPRVAVWWWCIVLHTMPRYFICFCYTLFYSTIASRLGGKYRAYIRCIFLCGFTEVTALLLLTLITSNINHKAHVAWFVVFVTASLLYMLLTLLIQASLIKTSNTIKLDTSLRLKVLIFCGYIMFLLMFFYLYYRHNRFCEPGVYSLSALSEYQVVLMNMAFHATGALDFQSSHWVGHVFKMVHDVLHEENYSRSDEEEYEFLKIKLV